MVFVLCGMARQYLNGAEVTFTTGASASDGRVVVTLVACRTTHISVRKECVKTIDPDAQNDDQGDGADAEGDSDSYVPTAVDSDEDTIADTIVDSDDDVAAVSEIPQTDAMAEIGYNLAFKRPAAEMVNKWSTEHVSTAFARSGGRTKDLFQSCTVIDVNGRMYGIRVVSDAKGARDQVEAASAKLGITVGGETNLERASSSLSPEEKKRVERLIKIRARISSSYKGEARNAEALYKKRLGEFGGEINDILTESINVSRATRFGGGEWGSGSLVNKVSVSFMGYGQRTEFFRKLELFSGKAHGCVATHTKRKWNLSKHVELGFSGLLPCALDSALLCVTAADLAFSYAAPFRRNHQALLSGFITGLSSDYVHADATNTELKKAREMASLWLGVTFSRSSRVPVKRRGEAFEQGRAAGISQKAKVRKTHEIKDK